MSSLRNAINRRAHKEQAQPNARRKFGLLEKHKDYVVRAKGYHKGTLQANKYTQEELTLMKTQDIGYILQKLQSEKMKVEKLTAMLHSLDNHLSNGHIYYTEDREKAKEIRSQPPQGSAAHSFEDLPDSIKRKTAASYRELVARKSRASELQKLYMEMALKEKQSEAQTP